MTTQPESRISRAIQEELRANGIFVFKVHGSQYMPVGLPDLIACVDGIFVGLEVKTPDQRDNTSVVQKYQHERIRAAKGYAFVVCSAAEAMALVRRIRRQLRVIKIPKDQRGKGRA